LSQGPDSLTTTELADLDAKISGAADKVLALELEIFEAFVARAASFAEPIRMSAHAMAQLDVQTAAGFTANDCSLDADIATAPRLTLITGPNMAGKSTYLRQNALMFILAQAGSFVPATSLRILAWRIVYSLGLGLRMIYPKGARPL